MRSIFWFFRGIVQNYYDTKIFRRIRYFLIQAQMVLLAGIFGLITWYFVPFVLSPWWIIAPSLVWMSLISITITPPGPIGKMLIKFKKFRDAGRYGRGGNARFSGWLEEESVRQKGDGSIFVGRSLFSGDNVYLSDDRHMITIAGSRSGKGAACIIPNLLRYSGSVLCIDPKGTNARVTAQCHSKQTSVAVLDPFGQTGLPTVTYNPLDTIDLNAETVVEDISLISDALIADESKDNAHFSETAKILLNGFIAHVYSSGDFPNPSLTDVYDLIANPSDDPARLNFAMRKNPACSGLAQAAAKKIEETKGDKEFNSSWSTLTRNLKWLASKPMQEFLSQRSTLDINQMKYKKTRIYLVLPPNMMKTHASFLRLFVNLTMSRYSRGTPATLPGLFIIDEAHSLGYMQDIAKGYGLMASYKMILWCFFQDKGQIDKLYGEEASTMFGSSRAIQLFNLVGKDADWAASLLGTRGAVDAHKIASSGAIVNFRDAGSVTQEIGTDSKKQYIIRPGETPLLIERYPYFVDKDLVSYWGPLGTDPDHPGRSQAHRAAQRERTIGLIAGQVLAGTLVLGFVAMIAAGIVTAPFYWMSGTDMSDYPWPGRIVAGIAYVGMLFFYIENFDDFWGDEKREVSQWRD